MQKLVIYLQNVETTHASWVIVDNDNKIIHSVAHGDMTQLSSFANYDAYVVVPAQDVLLTSVQLPKLSRPRLLQALPFALEEQLIDDVSELHFAIGEYEPDGKLSVAIVSQEKMLAWTHLLQDHGISPRAFIPGEFTLPYVEDNWQINCYEQHCVARTGKYHGFACEQDNLETILELKLAEEPEDKKINLTRTHLSDQQLLENLAADINSLVFINLLQSNFQAKPQASKIKKVWQAACYFAMAWIALAFFGNFISYFILHHQGSKIDVAIKQIYMRNFPQAKSVVAPRDRMTEKLRLVTGGANKNNSLALLGILGNSLLKAPGIHIQNLDFREQQLTLEVQAGSFENLDTLTHLLTQQGLSVKQQNATAAGTQVKATLLIRAGAA